MFSSNTLSPFVAFVVLLFTTTLSGEFGIFNSIFVSWTGYELSLTLLKTNNWTILLSSSFTLYTEFVNNSAPKFESISSVEVQFTVNLAFPSILIFFFLLTLLLFTYVPDKDIFEVLPKYFKSNSSFSANSIPTSIVILSPPFICFK